MTTRYTPVMDTLDTTPAGRPAITPTDRLLRRDEPYSVRTIVEILTNAADHLLHDHDCDAHGWEGVDGALQAARQWLTDYPELLRAALSPPSHTTPAPLADDRQE